MGWAIRRADGTYRGWSAHARTGPLYTDETWEELATKPAITVPPETDSDVLAGFDAMRALKALALALSNQTLAGVAYNGATGYTPVQIRARFLAAWKAL